jgi:hypothetical protein
VTLEEAVGLLEARAGKIGNTPKARRAAGRKQASGKAAKSAAKAKKPAAAAKSKPARRTKATAAE